MTNNDRLILLRVKKNLTREELALQLNITVEDLIQYELYNVAIPKEVITKIDILFGIKFKKQINYLTIMFIVISVISTLLIFLFQFNTFKNYDKLLNNNLNELR